MDSSWISILLPKDYNCLHRSLFDAIGRVTVTRFSDRHHRQDCHVRLYRRHRQPSRTKTPTAETTFSAFRPHAMQVYTPPARPKKL